MTAARLAAIAGFRLVTPDPARLGRFYAAIGFTVGAAAAIVPRELELLGQTGGTRTSLRLGASLVELDRYEGGGQPYPADMRATDTGFQHLALVTDDAVAAWERALAAGATSISRDGPVTLPASSGGVTAIKFRDPDGHPLEFLQFPRGASRWAGHGVLGIDHSAVVVADVARSRGFSEGHGLSAATATVNRGPAQDALDDAEGVEADVVAMDPDEATPHVELLGYRTPRPRPTEPWRIADIAATRIVWRAPRDALLRDPDGHLHQLVAGSSPV